MCWMPIATSASDADTVRESITRTASPPSSSAAASALANVPDNVEEICTDRIRS